MKNKDYLFIRIIKYINDSQLSKLRNVSRSINNMIECHRSLDENKNFIQRRWIESSNALRKLIQSEISPYEKGNVVGKHFFSKQGIIIKIYSYHDPKNQKFYFDLSFMDYIGNVIVRRLGEYEIPYTLWKITFFKTIDSVDNDSIDNDSLTFFSLPKNNYYIVNLTNFEIQLSTVSFHHPVTYIKDCLNIFKTNDDYNKNDFSTIFDVMNHRFYLKKLSNRSKTAYHFFTTSSINYSKSLTELFLSTDYKLWLMKIKFMDVPKQKFNYLVKFKPQKGFSFRQINLNKNETVVVKDHKNPAICKLMKKGCKVCDLLKY